MGWALAPADPVERALADQELELQRDGKGDEEQSHRREKRDAHQEADDGQGARQDLAGVHQVVLEIMARKGVLQTAHEPRLHPGGGTLARSAVAAEYGPILDRAAAFLALHVGHLNLRNYAIAVWLRFTAVGGKHNSRRPPNLAGALPAGSFRIHH
jgi:hypothetical protein